MGLYPLSGITFQQLEIFMTAAKYENLSKAAEQLHMTTASVSRNIATLERQLGIMLFTRHKQRIFLTDAGVQLAKGLPELESQLQTLLREAFSVQTSQFRTLRIGDGNFLPSSAYLLPVIRHFEENYPEIELEVSRVDPPEVINGLLEKRFDLIFAVSVAKDLEKAKDIKFVPFLRFTPQILLSRNHPLYGKLTLTADEIRAQRIVVMADGIYEGYWEKVQRVLNHLQIPASQVKIVRDPIAVTLELLRGRSISIMSELFALVEHDNFKIFEIPDLEEYWEVCLAYLPENRHTYKKKFINSAINVFQSQELLR